MADYIKKRTHIIGHERFLNAGPIARDLYDWGMLWSGFQETDGRIPLIAVETSAWGAGMKKNLAVAARLVEVGLWEKTEGGFQILKWAEQGNVTKALLIERRQAEKDKKAAQRSRLKTEPVSPACPPGTPQGNPAGVLNSPFNSPSGSSESRSEDPSSTPRAFLPEPANDQVPPVPDWWAGSCATASEAVGGLVVSDPVARWGEYDISRERLKWARNHRDAVGYLTKVLRSERDKAPRSSSRSGGGPRGDRQGMDGWTPPKTGTDNEVIGGNS